MLAVSLCGLLVAGWPNPAYARGGPGGGGNGGKGIGAVAAASDTAGTPEQTQKQERSRQQGQDGQQGVSQQERSRLEKRERIQEQERVQERERLLAAIRERLQNMLQAAEAAEGQTAEEGQQEEQQKTAVTELQKELREGLKDLKFNLGQLKKHYRVQRGSKESKEVREMLKEIVRLAKRNAAPEELEELLKEAVALDPGGKEFYEELASLYRKQGNTVPRVFSNGAGVDFGKFGVQPVIKEGRLLIPVRAIMEALGADVKWDGEKRTVIIKKGDVTIELPVDKRVALVNGKEVILDVPAGITNNRVIVPLRFIAEALRAAVDYYGEGPVVTIDTEESSETAATAGASEAAEATAATESAAANESNESAVTAESAASNISAESTGTSAS